ncbi:MAG: sugar ABC transporter permease [Candidatus Pacebacteria bacterium]|nr:sugar ABC transporter permease [Candidatus Paceibacterota bacterium]
MVRHFMAALQKHKMCYALILPTFFLVFLFRYYPAFSGVYHSFFEWDGALLEEWVGFSNYIEAFQDAKLWRSFLVVIVFISANIVKMIPAIIVALLIFHLKSEKHQYLYRVLFVVPMIIPQIVYMLLWKFFYEPNIGLLNQLLIGLGIVEPDLPPMWLADPEWVIPSLIFMGFPWVGVVSVLIFLAGLQSIPNSVYEAADLDGCGILKRCVTIEVPLIMSQIRLSLVLMIIATLKGFERILIMCNEFGGPNGAANVPGLYMFRMAFMEGRVGYACALGMLLFGVILVLTLLNDKYVRVEK